MWHQFIFENTKINGAIYSCVLWLEPQCSAALSTEADPYHSCRCLLDSWHNVSGVEPFVDWTANMTVVAGKLRKCRLITKHYIHPAILIPVLIFVTERNSDFHVLGT